MQGVILSDFIFYEMFSFSVVKTTCSQAADSMCLPEGVFLDWEPCLQEQRYFH